MPRRSENEVYVIDEAETVSPEMAATLDAMANSPLAIHVNTSGSKAPALTEASVDARWADYKVIPTPTEEEIAACWKPGRTKEEFRMLSTSYTGRYARGPAGDIVPIDG